MKPTASWFAASMLQLHLRQIPSHTLGHEHSNMAGHASAHVLLRTSESYENTLCLYDCNLELAGDKRNNSKCCFAAHLKLHAK